MITLGVSDLSRSRSFYEALGWQSGAEPADDVVFFQAGDVVLALWDRVKLAQDSCVEDSPGWGGVTLALNLGSPGEVDAATEQARAPSGASRLRLFGAATARCSLTPTVIRGRSPTTHIGLLPPMGA